MKRLVFCLCVLASLAAVGCGPKLTKEEETAPPPRGPNAGYQPPPRGANQGSAVRGPRGSSMQGAPPGMGR